MKIIEISLRSYPKPAGAVGYGGKITMMGSRNGQYGKWVSAAKKAIKNVYSTKDEAMPKHLQIYGVVYHHMMPTRVCGDILNIMGSITDVLVKLEIIKDDSPKYLPLVAGGVYFQRYAIQDGEKVLTNVTEPSIKIILCESQEDWLRAIKPL